MRSGVEFDGQALHTLSDECRYVYKEKLDKTKGCFIKIRNKALHNILLMYRLDVICLVLLVFFLVNSYFLVEGKALHGI